MKGAYKFDDICEYKHDPDKKQIKIVDKTINNETIEDLLNCDKCNFKATCKVTLNEHTKTFHSSQIYPCDQCKYKALNKESIDEHKETFHNINYSCDNCDFEAVKKDRLILHIAETHQISCIKNRIDQFKKI